MLDVELPGKCRVPLDTKSPPDRKNARSDASKANIANVTDELGRHAGDAGETKRIDVLTKLHNKVASDGAKARRKSAPVKSR